ncbi:MAG TPA: hypothetical protein PLZ55_04620 [bacterium]|nr:hypothetical protein [bacterium]HPO07929.1 hypothetical protein [bacterium]HQP98322.1 hypothetical protein [bacterium]
MSRQKRKKRADQPIESRDTALEAQENTGPVSHQRFTAWDYLFANLFFWVFCWLQRTVASYLNGDDMGLSFFFYTMALGFTIVSIVAFIHDLLSGDIVQETEL